MKANIHPEYHHIKAVCACGNEIELGSVNREMHVEICSACQDRKSTRLNSSHGS